MHSNNTILSSDTYANDRADSHINMMRKQREGWENKKPPATIQPKAFKIIKTTTWGANNEK